MYTLNFMNSNTDSFIQLILHILQSMTDFDCILKNRYKLTLIIRFKTQEDEIDLKKLKFTVR